VPKSFAEAMANNEILQIVVFSMFFGVALASLGEKAKTLVAGDRRALATRCSRSPAT
jgi:Na+/H+-dicarboxylate symporter